MIRSVLNTISRGLTLVCIVFMAAIVAVLFYAVVMRYVFHNPPSWSMEVSRLMFLWTVMLGSALVTRENSHIQITFILNALPKTPRTIWMVTMNLAMLFICLIIITEGIRIYPTVSEALSPSLGLSMGWFYLCIPVGAFFMALYVTENLIRTVNEYIRSLRSERNPCH
ncbi:TRAP transporter small permease [Thermodesulforhabdus norvegica]|uniref:TRAP-type C4-dicarboxylate transport system, small permease component n=1 Tax=Thermodesulforhabdus norvegica TaxID=39841 RepID=A0A1I4R4X3_9BACT|nr:TRAP transporter small permease [Thermodesulforhabdus norvegica]SFM46980.1 TRAP-type C4-dicarboxylate transport system, small permease component [Thermodesulforhabdus norvegica]